MKKPAIAYYSAEYAIDDDLPIYAGGLGVLAADVVLEAGAQGWPMVAFGMAYQHAVASKNWAEDRKAEILVESGFVQLADRRGDIFESTVDFGDWNVKVGAWVREFGSARLILIDTDVPGNSDLDRRLSSNLYDPDLMTRLLQEFIMAHASLTILDALGTKVDHYHMNEGHMAFVGIALAARWQRAHGPMALAEALEVVRPRLVGTKHTILPGAGDFADLETLERLFGSWLARHGWTAAELLAAGCKANDPKTFSTTALMLKTAVRNSAVSVLHAEAEHVVRQTSSLIPVTNGVFRPRWQNGNLSGELKQIRDRELWLAHDMNRADLIDFANYVLGTGLDPEMLTVVWARRFASYKRPTLLFSDVERLQRIMRGIDGRGVQVILSGNANEVDEEGMRILDEIMGHAQNPAFGGRLIYLPHYATDLSLRLVSGADLWLNTPIRGMEACGTSGMKAGLNGALQMSTSDGWIDEVDLGEIGWELPVADTAEALYGMLECEVVPMFYDRDKDGVPIAWVRRLRRVMEVTEDRYTTERMLGDYRAKLYLER